MSFAILAQEAADWSDPLTLLGAGVVLLVVAVGAWLILR